MRGGDLVEREDPMDLVLQFAAPERVRDECSGIRVRLQKWLIYTVAGIFFGIAGLMQLSRLTQGDPTVAIGLELDIIA